MCNMAAYAGKAPAAPKLVNMLRNQEYLCGGHYTGIATICGNKIHMIKVIGPVSELLRRHPEVLDLPGTVGIAHSRTPGFDDDAWAQPFFSSDEKVIYCANGSAGRFKDTVYQQIYDQFKQSGTVFRTARKVNDAVYPVMDDGMCVHSSEIMANVVADFHKSMKLHRAMHAALCQFPSEIAALALSVKEEESVSALRLNQPLMLGRDDSGFYLATSAFALEKEDITCINRVPHASSLSMTCDSVTIDSLDEFLPLFLPQAPVTDIFSTLDEMLFSDCDVEQLCQTAEKCWPADKLATANMETYEYLRDKVRSGLLEYFDTEVPGSSPALTAPRRRFKLRPKDAL